MNSCLQQAKVEKIYQRKVAEKLMTDGVTIIDPTGSTSGELTCGRDVVIDINAVFIGDVVLGDRVTVGPNCVLKDCEIGTDSVISPCTVIEGSKLGRHRLSDRSQGSVPAASLRTRFMSETSSSARTPRWAREPNPGTSPILATRLSAGASTSAPAPSPATMTASTSSRPSSAMTCLSAQTRRSLLR